MLYFLHKTIKKRDIKANSLLILTQWTAANITSSFCIIFPIYFLLLAGSQSKNSNSTVGIIIFILLILLLLLTNIVNITISNKKDPIKRLLLSMLFGAILLLYTLISFQKLDIIFNKALEIYKIGNFEVNSIVLTKEGCDIFNAYGIITTPINDKCRADEGRIISKVGTETYLEFNHKKFPISSENILSWVPKSAIKEKNE